jgi:hypothetical protein
MANLLPAVDLELSQAPPLKTFGQVKGSLGTKVTLILGIGHILCTHRGTRSAWSAGSLPSPDRRPAGQEEVLTLAHG